MNTKDILQVLQQKTTAAVAASAFPNLPVKYVGLSFTPPNDGRYLEVIFLPNNPSDQAWGEEEYHRGLFRLILHWQNNKTGPYTPLDLISNIGSSFSKHERLGEGVKILNKARVNPPIENGLETMYPVTLEYDTLFVV